MHRRDAELVPCATEAARQRQSRFQAIGAPMQALIAVCVLLVAFCGLQTFRVTALKQEIATKEAAIATATAAAERQARERESEMADNARKAADTYAANLKRAQAGAAGALSELDSLRNVIASTSPAAPASAASSATNGTGGPERELLGACAAALQGMAAQADRLESKVVGLQDYIRGLTK